jgi:hypothetical protein
MNMEHHGTERRFRRLVSKVKRQKATPPTSSPPDNQVVSNEYNDRQLAQVRYKEAANLLTVALSKSKGPWGSFHFEQLSGEPEGFDDLQFKNKINQVFMAREKSIKDRKGWAKFTYAVECVFAAFSPFAKNFLAVAKDAQSVIHLSHLFIYI